MVDPAKVFDLFVEASQIARILNTERHLAITVDQVQSAMILHELRSGVKMQFNPATNSVMVVETEQ
jgi:hypothetical protein